MRLTDWKTGLVVLFVSGLVANPAGAYVAVDAGVNPLTSHLGSWSAGWEFTPSQDIRVTMLGLWQPAYWGVLGFREDHPIKIWEKVTSETGAVSYEEVLSATIAKGAQPGNPTIAGYAYTDQVQGDATLSAARTYIIAAFWETEWVSEQSSSDPFIWSCSGGNSDLIVVEHSALSISGLDLQVPTYYAGDYRYYSVTFQFEPADVPPSPIAVDIDIKPGCSPNTLNLGANGVIPVAILWSEDFDPLTVDTSTVLLEGKAGVRLKGNGTYLTEQRDINGDGHVDLVVKIEVENLEPGDIQDGVAEITGQTTGGLLLKGVDEVTIVPQ